MKLQPLVIYRGGTAGSIALLWVPSLHGFLQGLILSLAYAVCV